MHRLDCYTHEFINPYLLQRKSLLFKEDLICNSFDKVVLNISLNNLKSDEDYFLILAQKFLESIAPQKAFVSKKEYVYIGTRKVFKAGVSTTLRKRIMYNFMDYFFFVILPAYTRRYGLLPLLNVTGALHEISIHDLTLLFDLKSFFDDNVKLKVIFYPKNSLNSFKDYLCFFGCIFDE